MALTLKDMKLGLLVMYDESHREVKHLDPSFRNQPGEVLHWNATLQDLTVWFPVSGLTLNCTARFLKKLKE